MARPQRYNVDYFPHYISDGKKMFIIESRFGNDGYATWFKILETLSKTDHHYIDLFDQPTLMFLAARCHVTEDRLIEIIDAIVMLGELDSELWGEHKVLWSHKFVESIKDAYRNRSNNCMPRMGLLRHIEGLRAGNGQKSVVKPQSKVKETKEEESKGEMHPLLSWIDKECPTVHTMKRPIDEYEANKLLEEFDKQYIKETLWAMENKTDLHTKRSANLTFRSWSKLNDHYKKWKQSNETKTFKPNPIKI